MKEEAWKQCGGAKEIVLEREQRGNGQGVPAERRNSWESRTEGDLDVAKWCTNARPGLATGSWTNLHGVEVQKLQKDIQRQSSVFIKKQKNISINKEEERMERSYRR